MNSFNLFRLYLAFMDNILLTFFDISVNLTQTVPWLVFREINSVDKIFQWTYPSVCKDDNKYQ